MDKKQKGGVFINVVGIIGLLVAVYFSIFESHLGFTKNEIFWMYGISVGLIVLGESIKPLMAKGVSDLITFATKRITGSK